MLLFITETWDLIHCIANGHIVISATYLRNHPKDIDLVTHELMHVVQSYPDGQPGWFVEGIADYVQWKYGRDYAAANWKLPRFYRNQRSTDAYVVTGRIWNQITGKSVHRLWKDHAANSKL